MFYRWGIGHRCGACVAESSKPDAWSPVPAVSPIGTVHRCDTCGAVGARATWWEVDGCGRRFGTRHAAARYAADRIGQMRATDPRHLYRFDAVPGRRSMVYVVDLDGGRPVGAWSRVGFDVERDHQAPRFHLEVAA